MQEALQALLGSLHEAERRAEDEETQPALLLLLDLLLQLRPSLEDLSAVPVGVLVSRLGKKSSRVSEAVRERAVRCKRAWQALLQEHPSTAAYTATAAAAPPSAEESGGQRAAQTARLGRCFSGLCDPPEWTARELEHVLYARIAAGTGDRQRKKQRCAQPAGYTQQGSSNLVREAARPLYPTTHLLTHWRTSLTYLLRYAQLCRAACEQLGASPLLQALA